MFRFKTKLKKRSVQLILSENVGPLTKDFGSWAMGKGWSISSDTTKKHGRITRVYIEDSHKESAVAIYFQHAMFD